MRHILLIALQNYTAAGNQNYTQLKHNAQAHFTAAVMCTDSSFVQHVKSLICAKSIDMSCACANNQAAK